MQGKLFQKWTHLLYCSLLSLDGNVNTRRMAKPDMGSIFHIKKSMKLLCELSNYQNLMLLTSSDTEQTSISCLQIPPKENWFQYVRRVYATAINFPCITPLGWKMLTASLLLRFKVKGRGSTYFTRFNQVKGRFRWKYLDRYLLWIYT